MRPVPVVFLLIAFTLQLSASIQVSGSNSTWSMMMINICKTEAPEKTGPSGKTDLPLPFVSLPK